jgi:bifunctional non-homologous end joining protein LigD
VIDERPPPLQAYRRKRDPERTPEPFGGGIPGGGRRFVVQQHAARRLHYDFRLEMDGVLKSWAVPAGPSVRPEVRRLAVHVEDHPVEYADFEGVIPAGNYGAGAVIVWDQGTYRPVKAGDPLADLARGKLEVELVGYKLRGRFTVVRMSGKEKEWLLLKKAGAGTAEVEATERYPRSVVSGLTVEEMRDPEAVRAALRARLAALGAPRREVAPAEQAFMLATLAEQPFSDPRWLFEVKYDGVRVLASRQGDSVVLRGRSGQVVTTRYPEVAAALRRLLMNHFVIDGEIVAPDDEGKPSFQRLQARMGLTAPRDVERAVAAVPVTGIFFDCLTLDGHDLRRLPLIERKACLARLLPPLGPVRYGDHVVGEGEAFFAAAEAARLEGIVAKRSGASYAGRRSPDWVKIKCQKRQEFVIGGYTDPQGSRGHFGALHVGLYEGPRLVYVSKVGTGFDAAGLRRVWQALQPLARAGSPFHTGTPAGRGHHWAEPRLVCEVRFTEWTREGGLRHPTFLGLRPDKRPEDCRRESAVVLPPPPANRPAPPAGTPREVRVTNPTKVFWPAEGYTKGDLIAYYDRIAPRLLPYLRDRPVVLTRYPDGISGKSFFQKDAPDFVPSWVRTERIYSKDADREIDYFIVNDAQTLRYVVNLGTIPLHLWSARLGHLDRPDWLVLDLDPKGAPFAHVVTMARVIHRLLETLDLRGYVKTSGATGLHILLPLGARYSHEEARTFARVLAVLAVEARPDLATIARPIQARGGKVYVDFGQNGHGRTIVAPFAVRPRPGAPVSCPLAWREVTARLDPARFTIVTAPARFRRQRDPLAPVLAGGIDMPAALARIDTLLRRPRLTRAR